MALRVDSLVAGAAVALLVSGLVVEVEGKLDPNPPKLKDYKDK